MTAIDTRSAKAMMGGSHSKADALIANDHGASEDREGNADRGCGCIHLPFSGRGALPTASRCSRSDGGEAGNGGKHEDGKCEDGMHEGEAGEIGDRPRLRRHRSTTRGRAHGRSMRLSSQASDGLRDSFRPQPLTLKRCSSARSTNPKGGSSTSTAHTASATESLRDGLADSMTLSLEEEEDYFRRVRETVDRVNGGGEDSGDEGRRHGRRRMQGIAKELGRRSSCRRQMGPNPMAFF